MYFHVILALLLSVLAGPGHATVSQGRAVRQQTVALDPPARVGRVSVEAAIASRRSVRFWKDQPLTRAQLSQILWAAQGVTGAGGLRSVASAGALYPLEVYVAVARVTQVPPGAYRYVPREHVLKRVATPEEPRRCIATAGYQDFLQDAPAILVIAAVPSRTEKKYGERAGRYLVAEAGGAMQNVYLQAEAIALGTVAVGAFNDPAIVRCLSMPQWERPLLLMPVGRKAS